MKPISFVVSWGGHSNYCLLGRTYFSESPSGLLWLLLNYLDSFDLCVPNELEHEHLFFSNL
ncbi:hypothetical protein MHLP_00440 [Candidatus Mycoplasma haematolamae str. Purdue]|uniref:Uncharacterized protein n=1 Tax=Mycoplasma haematolamae (strain Purdue) TaxID=1212765 RepID=I7BIL9_MYCHA|nr:hypothetical protein MHLP_00440 [Candidatus Mycoplasma haematolamae str. Purdue]